MTGDGLLRPLLVILKVSLRAPRTITPFRQPTANSTIQMAPRRLINLFDSVMATQLNSDTPINTLLTDLLLCTLSFRSKRTQDTLISRSRALIRTPINQFHILWVLMARPPLSLDLPFLRK